MNEQTNEVFTEGPEEVIEQAVDAVDGDAGEGLTNEEFDAIWDEDDDAVFVEQDEPAEADQPEEEQPEPTAEAGETSKQAEADTDQWLELKHLDEVRKVSKEEAKVLAQKGMDYDRIRGKLTEAEANNAKMQRYEEFFDEVRGDMSVEDLIDDTLARVRADRTGKDYETVKAQIVAERKQKEQHAQPAQPEVTRESVYNEMRQQSFTQFVELYPNVKAKEIPQEVWDDMKKTNNLVASYAKYEAKKLAKENEILKNNAENLARSAGSMKSTGKAAQDEIDRMWYDDDD